MATYSQEQVGTEEFDDCKNRGVFLFQKLNPAYILFNLLTPWDPGRSVLLVNMSRGCSWR